MFGVLSEFCPKYVTCLRRFNVGTGIMACKDITALGHFIVHTGI